MNSDTHTKRMSRFETVADFSAPGLPYIMESREASVCQEAGTVGLFPRLDSVFLHFKAACNSVKGGNRQCRGLCEAI